MNAIITLNDYLEKRKTFVIPTYQRGYVWGKKRIGEKDSVTNLLDNLLSRFKNNSFVFLQGITVTEKEDEIILIDGQQRTTCFYLILKWLGYIEPLKIHYSIRRESDLFLQSSSLIENIEDNPDEEFQDIYFFKKTLRIVDQKLADIDKSNFMIYLLNKVKFLYIDIDESQAIKVFSMMNGSKAQMLQEEIIKAEILRLASLYGETDEDYSIEWENKMLRSRFAREWDKWLSWWNKQEVKILYCCSNPLGRLIPTFMLNDMPATFENFKNSFLSKELPVGAKQVFDALRRLQKRFEDAFNNPQTHNWIGTILRIFNHENQQKFLNYYFKGSNSLNLKNYYMLTIIGLTHDEIVKRDSLKFSEKYDLFQSTLNDDFLYFSKNKEFAFRYLLKLNVDQDVLLNRFFDFTIWGNRSLEHIQPKSKVGHQDSKGTWFDGNDKQCDIKSINLKRDDIRIQIDGKTISTTEHSIGNLVLLYGDENSAFNNSDFEKKKILFFSPSKNELFKSRHLLHTICVFAEKQDWNGRSIVENKIETIKKFIDDFSDLRRDYGYDEQD